MKIPDKIPDRWRQINNTDICCNNPNNLKKGEDYNNGTILDGAWICSKCNKKWIGNSNNQYLNHPLETLTEYGKAFFSAIDQIIKEEKPLRLANVLIHISQQKGK